MPAACIECKIEEFIEMKSTSSKFKLQKVGLQLKSCKMPTPPVPLLNSKQIDFPVPKLKLNGFSMRHTTTPPNRYRAFISYPKGAETALPYPTDNIIIPNCSICPLTLV